MFLEQVKLEGKAKFKSSRNQARQHSKARNPNIHIFDSLQLSSTPNHDHQEVQ